ncbi:DUF3238 domain-containing protein [Actinophytocola sp.]|uniref:DUF3238 domain-containing protein n=1 Tax=Actinophytocola sp. TaxID=1872138 RepID=UPI002D7EECEF|nr:DUF3238 domain-containing protein [Actinophytocola sp.]HET9141634.1 DUF3238 domain-containing protein [Actinophytocola sp.]
MAGEPDLSPGQSSEWVQYLQRMLNQHYQQSVVPENGEFDEATANAVEHFRSQNGLGGGSHVDSAVWGRLVPAGHGPSEGHHTGGHSGHASEHGHGTRHQAEPIADPVAGVHSGDPHDAGVPLDQPHGDDPATGIDTRAASTHWPDAHSVKVWLKVFIPGSYHGNVDGRGAAAGHRLLPGPSQWFNDCFHTDDREFSADIGASARAHSEFRLDLRTGELHEVHYCGESVEYDCEDGDEECRDTAPSGRMAWSNLRQHGDNIHLDLAGATSNPCFGGSPDIDYNGTVTIDLTGHTISFNGQVNGFPAYEAYATVNDGAGEPLFHYGPRGTPMDLSGDAADPVHGSASF